MADNMNRDKQSGNDKMPNQNQDKTGQNQNKTGSQNERERNPDGTFKDDNATTAHQGSQQTSQKPANKR